MQIDSRPSTIRKQDECIWFKDDGFAGESPYVQRGNKIHPWVPKLYRNEPIGSWTMVETPDVAAATWVADELKRLLIKVEFEKSLKLMDLFVTPPELIMQGTCDIFGYNRQDEVLEIWDIKTGMERDYHLQLMAYALMAMDLTGEVEARIRVAYCDVKLFQQSIVTRSDCEDAIFSIIERIRLGVEPPRENEFCGQCARQSVCEVWTKPTELTLDIIDTQPLVDMAPALDPTLTLQNRLEMIKADPAMLGRFIDIWRKANVLIEKYGIEDRAKELLISGKEVPGWKAVEYQGRAFYNKEQIEKILAEWGESAADFLAVNRERYEGACNNSDNDCLEPEGRGKSFYKLLRKK